MVASGRLGSGFFTPKNGLDQENFFLPPPPPFPPPMWKRADNGRDTDTGAAARARLTLFFFLLSLWGNRPAGSFGGRNLPELFLSPPRTGLEPYPPSRVPRGLSFTLVRSPLFSVRFFLGPPGRALDRGLFFFSNTPEGVRLGVTAQSSFSFGAAAGREPLRLIDPGPLKSAPRTGKALIATGIWPALFTPFGK